MYIFCFVQVCANGVISFGRRYESYTTPENQQFSTDLLNIYALTPYFTDLDLTTSGTVWYRVYDLTEDSSADVKDVLKIMQDLVSEIYAQKIHPIYVFKATWENVPLYGESSAEVNMFREFLEHCFTCIKYVWFYYSAISCNILMMIGLMIYQN